MANELNGSDIYLIIDNDIFANEKGVSNSESTDTLETTNKHSTAKRKTFIGGESTGTITANGLYCVSDPSGTTGYHDLKAKQLAGTAVTYEVGYVATGGIIESGSGIITACNMSADQNGAAVYDISIQKSGVYAEASYSS